MYKEENKYENKNNNQYGNKENEVGEDLIEKICDFASKTWDNLKKPGREIKAAKFGLIWIYFTKDKDIKINVMEICLVICGIIIFGISIKENKFNKNPSIIMQIFYLICGNAVAIIIIPMEFDTTEITNKLLATATLEVPNKLRVNWVNIIKIPLWYLLAVLTALVASLVSSAFLFIMKAAMKIAFALIVGGIFILYNYISNITKKNKSIKPTK